MKNLYKWLIGVFAILFLVVGGLFLFTPVFQSTLSSTFTPVYCNDPTSVCCVKTLTQPSDTINYNLYGSCPTTASGKCVISQVQSQASKTSVTLYVGSQNCRIVQKIIPIAQVYQCDDQSAVTVAVGVTNIEVPRGYIYFTDVYSGKATVTRDTYGEKLITNLGAVVQGSSCQYTAPAGTKLTNSGYGSLGASYTVPVGSAVGTSDSCILTWNAGNRHICGNLEEQCTADSDCTGHTYGTKECYQRTLQTYGCTQLGTPSGLSNGFLGQDAGLVFAPLGSTGTSQNSNNYGVTSRCEIQSASPVQCCGDTDCGSSLICDKTTFTCKAPQQVGCKANSDCGVSTQCDYASLQLKTPKCTIVGLTGTCGYSSKPVQCCNDGNCAYTQTCDLTSHVCIEKVPVKDSCAFTCCNADDPSYLPRDCPATQYCVNHECNIQPQCSDTKPCATGLTCVEGVCKTTNNQTCTDEFFGLVKGNVGVKEGACGIFSNPLCAIGLKSPEKINVCVKNYTPLALVIVLILGLGGMVTYGVTRNKKGSHKKSSKSGSNILRSKTFWKAIIVLAIILAIVFLFKYIFWLIIALIVFFIFDALALHGFFRKIVFW